VCSIPLGLAYWDGVSDVHLVIQYIVLCEGACYSSIVVLLHEARCSSSSCSLDSSIRREVRLHRRVAHRIDVPHLQVACIAHVIERSYQIHWIKRRIMKDRAKQFSSSWYQSARLITVQLLSMGWSSDLLVGKVCWLRGRRLFRSEARQIRLQTVMYDGGDLTVCAGNLVEMDFRRDRFLLVAQRAVRIRYAAWRVGFSFRRAWSPCKVRSF
jgi:hypothetical protein